jgi:hypothetical protein
MGILSANAGALSFDGEGTLKSLFGEAKRFIKPTLKKTNEDASEQNAASGNQTAADSVTLSNLTISEASYRREVSNVTFSEESGTYTVSGSSENLTIAQTQISNISLLSSMQSDTAGEAYDSTLSLESDIVNQIQSQFPPASEAMSNFDSVANWFNSTDPALYNSFLIIMNIMLDENPTAAESMLSSLGNLRSSMSQMSAQSMGDISTGAVQAEFTASISATFTSVAGSLSEANGGEFTLRHSGESINISVSMQANMADPLILDLDGDGIDLRSAEDGAIFDIDGDGSKDQTAFIQGDDALLYLDQNSNGTADSGNELFGDQQGDANGFENLSKYDENNDGVIDEKDSIFEKLKLFVDMNADGINQINESMTLAEAGIESLNLGYYNINEEDEAGNKFTQESSFTKTDGSTNKMADAWFKYYTAIQ